MPTATRGCPCGAHVTDPDASVTYITDTLIDAVFSGVLSKVKYLGVLAPYIGNVVNVGLICSLPKPVMPDWTLADFVNPQSALTKAGLMLYNKIYELNCTCDDCPPITDCGEGDSLPVCPGDGYPVPDTYDRRYHIPTGSDVWIANSETCLGLKNGTWIYWYGDGPDNSVGHVNVRDGADNAPGDTWYVPDSGAPGPCLTLYFSGAQTGPIDPIPVPPDGVDDWYGPAPCTNSDICASLSETNERVRRIEFLTSVIAGPNFGLTSEIVATLPGVGNVSGSLVDVLPRLFEGIAPIQPSQLTNPVTSTVSSPTTIDVTDKAFLRITPTDVPASLGYRGSGDSEIYYSNHRTPGPGWAVLLGIDGVIAHRELIYPSGTEITIPSTCTAVALHLTAGVTATVTTYERQV